MISSIYKIVNGLLAILIIYDTHYILLGSRYNIYTTWQEWLVNLKCFFYNLNENLLTVVEKKVNPFIIQKQYIVIKFNLKVC